VEVGGLTWIPFGADEDCGQKNFEKQRLTC